jgi:cytochrome c553
MKNSIILYIVLGLFITSCNNDGRGYEFMPDMYRSPAIEAYSESDIYKNNMSARKPVEGTISRGNLSSFNFDASLEGYLEAGEKAKNPFDKTLENIEDGKELYAMFCKHCHGQNGSGGGTITHPIYSAVPHYTDSKTLRRCNLPMCDLKEGHIFHAITYGLNAMGPHASQLSEEERWKIVLYVQELQDLENKN